MGQRGFASIIILVTVIFGAVGFFGYKYFKSSNQPSAPFSTSKINSSPTSDWKTYKDDDLGFSIDNPVNWYLNRGNKQLTKFKDSSALTLSNSIDVFQNRFLGQNQAVINIDKYPKMEEDLENLSGEDFYNLKNPVWINRKNASGGGAEKTIKTYSVAYLNNLKVIKENIKFQGTIEGPELNRTFYLFPDSKDKTFIWVIRTETQLNDLKTDSLQNQIDQILSTFKFTQ